MKHIPGRPFRLGGAAEGFAVKGPESPVGGEEDEAVGVGDDDAGLVSLNFDGVCTRGVMARLRCLCGGRHSCAASGLIRIGANVAAISDNGSAFS